MSKRRLASRLLAVSAFLGLIAVNLSLVGGSYPSRQLPDGRFERVPLSYPEEIFVSLHENPELQMYLMIAVPVMMIAAVVLDVGEEPTDTSWDRLWMLMVLLFVGIPAALALIFLCALWLFG